MTPLRQGSRDAVLIVEQNPTGHRLFYVRVLVDAALAAGVVSSSSSGRPGPRGRTGALALRHRQGRAASAATGEPWRARATLAGARGDPCRRPRRRSLRPASCTPTSVAGLGAAEPAHHARIGAAHWVPNRRRCEDTTEGRCLPPDGSSAERRPARSKVCWLGRHRTIPGRGRSRGHHILRSVGRTIPRSKSDGRWALLVRSARSDLRTEEPRSHRRSAPERPFALGASRRWPARRGHQRGAPRPAPLDGLRRLCDRRGSAAVG